MSYWLAIMATLPGYIHSLLDQHRYFEILRFLNQWAQWPGRGYLSAFLMLGKPLVPTFLRGLAWLNNWQGSNPKLDRCSVSCRKGYKTYTASTQGFFEEAIRRRLAADLLQS